MAAIPARYSSRVCTVNLSGERKGGEGTSILKCGLRGPTIKGKVQGGGGGGGRGHGGLESGLINYRGVHGRKRGCDRNITKETILGKGSGGATGGSRGEGAPGGRSEGGMGSHGRRGKVQLVLLPSGGSGGGGCSLRPRTPLLLLLLPLVLLLLLLLLVLVQVLLLLEVLEVLQVRRREGGDEAEVSRKEGKQGLDVNE
ncbi:unnamed protein product [Closterium sp. NIES-54]